MRYPFPKGFRRKSSLRNFQKERENSKKKGEAVIATITHRGIYKKQILKREKNVDSLCLGEDVRFFVLNRERERERERGRCGTTTTNNDDDDVTGICTFFLLCFLLRDFSFSISRFGFFFLLPAMPTFTAIALDRLLEPRASNTGDRSAPISMPVPKSQNLERTTSAPAMKKKVPRPRLKPALYTTPEVTPLPDAPSSFPPSPYIINHKRRGPRLLKSTSEASVLAEQNIHRDGEKVNGRSLDAAVASSASAGDLQFTFTNPETVKKGQVNGDLGGELDSSNDGDIRNGDRVTGSNSIADGLPREKVPAVDSDRDREIEDFFDPQDSMSYTSNTDVEENAGTELSVKYSSPMEFYDAWEELSSEHGTQNSTHDVDAELREMRLSLLMEMEKRKQFEESLNNMRSQWERIRQGLYLAGIVLPANLTDVAEGEQLNSDPTEDPCQQLYVSRFVSNSIGRGMARAEVETEMEAQLEAKNFEIARLLERLRCYETMNREMSQRNQEVIELARRGRQRRSRRQRWVWGSITTAIVLGTAAIAWTYLPLGSGSSSSADHDLVPEHDDAAN